MTASIQKPVAAVDWQVSTAVGLWSLTATAAAVLTARAWAGAFDVPVPVVLPGLIAVIAIAVNLGAWTLFLRSGDRRSSPPLGSGSRLGVGLASLVAPAFIGGAAAMSASPVALGLVAGILTLGLSAVVVCEGIRMTSSEVREQQSDFDAATIPADHTSELFSVESAVDREPNAESGLVQQFARRRAADGSEQIEAVLFAVFAPKDRETALHLPIHPSLGGVPHVECEPLDDSAVITDITAAQPFGVRIEVKRQTLSDEVLSVPIGIEITVAGPVVNVA